MKKTTQIAVFIMLTAAVLLRAQAGPFYSEAFDRYDSSRVHFGDTTIYKLVSDTFLSCARIINSDSTASRSCTDSLPIDSLRGWKIVLSAWTKATGLSTPPASYNGVKVMLVIRNGDGSTSYPQLSWPATSSYGWTRGVIPVSISPDAQWIKLVIGLEKVSGSVYMDSLKIVRAANLSLPPARSASMAIPDFAPCRLRGAMIGTGSVDSAALVAFGSVWKGNLLRWQMNAPSGETNALGRSDYESLINAEIIKIEKALRICRTHSIMLVVDMHTLSWNMFADTAAQSRLIKTWRMLAAHFKDSTGVWGYDLANEPNEDTWFEGARFWNEMADTLARTIRALDTVKVLIVEPAQWGGADGFALLRPVGSLRNWDIHRVVYSFHCYDPHTLTHQGIGSGYPPFGAVYPGTIDNAAWDSTRLRQAVAPAVAFQRKYRVPLYVGEFSCVRWAASHSAIRWLTDFVRIIESYGWDWTYHAYKEYEGWSVEYNDTLNSTTYPLSYDTDRKTLLVNYYALNRNPYTAQAAMHPLFSGRGANECEFRIRGNCSPVVRINGLSGMVRVMDLQGRCVAALMSRQGACVLRSRQIPAGFYIASAGKRSFKIILTEQ